LAEQTTQILQITSSERN